VLRGRALEIVDERGQVRASITVFAADSTITMPDGTTGYPATVLLRLRDSHGHPNVKIEATDDGAGLILGGSADRTYVQALARGVTTSLKLSNKDGRAQVIRP
jgi:predicted NAD/FAD-binding protein